MNEASLLAQVKSLETQLAVLKARIRKLRKSEPPKRLADLYGILADEADTSDEEIDQAKYRFEWEGEEMR